MQRIIRKLALVALMSLAVSAFAAGLPAIGEWDGVTPSAKLDGPYENPTQANVPFGIISYYNQPWRAYMDTWAADKWLESLGTQWNVDRKYMEPLCRLFQETGLSSIRYEIGWGSMGWDDDLMPHVKANMKRDFTLFAKYGIRPLILLNAHHGVPCPVKDVNVTVVADAAKGDKTLKLKSADGIKPGYTGIQHPEYIANYPTITKIDPDGTCTLSAGLPFDIKAGPFRLVQTKYQPFQGTKLKDGTPVPAAQETFNGWLAYVAAVTKTAREALGTDGQPDAGFDLEVWNEQTFGSNFLDINRYYDQKIAFAESFTYTHTRAMQPGYRPGATLTFEQKGAYAILPMTIDWAADPANKCPGVRVISGFANQWPWDNGTGLWDHQYGFSRHYYTGGWRDCSPETPLSGRNTGTIDALGNFDGKKDGKDWHTIAPGSNFVPTFRCGFPEFMHSGFKTEMLSRDVTPDSRWGYMNGHGRYTHNGDYQWARVWQTEVNYDRNQVIDEVCKTAGVKRDDPRLLPMAARLAGKTLLRQYLFHAAKGLYRIYIFSPEPDPFGIGTLPKSFYTALEQNQYQLTDAVRKQVPPEWLGLRWLTTLMRTGEKLAAPRPLQVRELVEYQPRLAYAGDGTPAHPHRWNRDFFAVMPFQLSASKYVIPYYVVTLDMSHTWDATKDPLDPARYDMPPQQYDVTLDNVNGVGATVSAYDPMSNAAVPVQIVRGTASSVTVRLHAVDYPRYLVLTEAKPGPQILEPKVALAADGKLQVSWKTNIPVKATLTYGHNWQNRGANVVVLAGPKTAFVETLKTGFAGVNAVRITVTANGLTDVWPRWDEDPQGQVVVPGEGATAAAQKPVYLPRLSEDFVNAQGQFEGLALPTADTPSWSYHGTGAVGDFAKATPEGLAIDTTAQPGNNAGFRCYNWRFREEQGYTVELKVRVSRYVGGNLFSDGGFLVQVFGPQQLMQIDLSDKQLCVRNGKTTDVDFSAFRVVRLVKHPREGLFDVYVDGKLEQANVPTVGAGANAITFGDVQGQRGCTATLAYLRVDNDGAWLPAPPVPVTGIAMPRLAVSTVEMPARKIGYCVPKEAQGSGGGDDRTFTLGGVVLRAHYIPGGARIVSDYLPCTAPVDGVEVSTLVYASGTLRGQLYRYHLAAVAHPGMTNLEGVYLAMKFGGDDLLLLSATGTAEAMKAQHAGIAAFLAGVKRLP
jgi:hypothetical protein